MKGSTSLTVKLDRNRNWIEIFVNGDFAGYMYIAERSNGKNVVRLTALSEAIADVQVLNTDKL
jgi:hypothetical protein